MSGCFFKRFAPEGLRECDGPVQAHHAIKRQSLKRSLPRPRGVATDEELRAYSRRLRLALEDRRNLLSVCKRHHDLWHNARLVVPREAVPDDLELFAADYGLVHELDRQFGAREGAA